MISIFEGIFIKDIENVDSNERRRKYGVLLGGTGIFLNVILFIIKLVGGILTKSVAIVADAANNLSDAGSSLIQIIGYRLSGHKPDTDHPFGHGRVEYISGLIISIVIIIMGFELFTTSVGRMFHPVDVVFSKATVVILIISIFIKLYMYAYNKKYAEKLNSVVMQATAYDSLSDCLATAVVLLSMMISEYTGLRVDGFCGILVAGFIIYTGITSAKDTINPLLGEKPDKEFVDKIANFVMSYDGIVGVHDLVVHDYGAGRMMITLHAEVAANGNLVEIHDTIDNIERKLMITLGCHATIHMDPIVTDDEATLRMNRLCALIVKSIDEALTIHDFRMVAGPTHTNLIFDIVLPYYVDMTEDELKVAVEKKVASLPGNLVAVVNIDRPMV